MITFYLTLLFCILSFQPSPLRFDLTREVVRQEHRLPNSEAICVRRSGCRELQTMSCFVIWYTHPSVTRRKLELMSPLVNPAVSAPSCKYGICLCALRCKGFASLVEVFILIESQMHEKFDDTSFFQFPNLTSNGCLKVSQGVSCATYSRSGLSVRWG